MPREYRYYVYIVQSSSRRALYIGMTNNLHRRVFQHKTQEYEGFTDSYDAVRLVYWEKFRRRTQDHRSRKTIEELAKRKEAMADRQNESRVQRSGCRLVQKRKPQLCAEGSSPPNSVIPSEVEGPCV